jgi:pimeloyl-ACP methyl ester carboxylesterase
MTGVVIGHGGRGPGSHFFRDEVEILEARGHLVIATDCHMAGPEDPAEELRTFDEAVEVQRRAVDELWQQGARAIAFYGHSLGAARGLALAARDDRVRAVVVAAMGTRVADSPWDPVQYVRVPGPTRFFQQGTRDEIVPHAAARRLFEATVEPKLWREYDWDHGIDACPEARADRYAFLDEVLA